LPVLCLLAAAAWAFASYRSGGFVSTLIEATNHSDQSLDLLREYIANWGSLGPVAYVLFVIVEVLIAPIPGTLLYAPGGAIFGGALGGTLSLAGNVIGATLACLIARLLERRVVTALDSKGLERYRTRIVRRGGWVIFLLRLNPLTSSDLVSYAAGLVGVPAWKVALGTLAGMAPLCYAQAYLAERILRVLPGSLWVVIALGLTYFGVVVWIVVGGAGQRRNHSL